MRKIVQTTMEQNLNIMNNFSSMHDIECMDMIEICILRFSFGPYCICMYVCMYV